MGTVMRMEIKIKYEDDEFFSIIELNLIFIENHYMT